jgi:2-oxoglutarate dehydrogenase E2 component (dihydrolipoamide succinyltransferase)
MASARSFLSPKTLPRPAAAPATSPAPAAAPAAAPEPEDPAPAPAEAEPTYAIGSRVFVKRSSGEEAIAFVTEYDAGMKAYTLELESVGSGKIKRSLENAIRAAPAADAPASDVEA